MTLPNDLKPSTVAAQAGGVIDLSSGGVVPPMQPSTTFVRDEASGTSELLVVNAADMRLEATVQLPSRVPYGFHGTFIGAADIDAQL